MKEMKKLMMILIVLMFFGSVTMVAGGKNQGTTGTGKTTLGTTGR